MFALAPLGIAAAKFVGAHLVAAHLDRGATGAANTLEAAVTGLGMRFALGFGTAYYFTNPSSATASKSALARSRTAF